MAYWQEHLPALKASINGLLASSVKSKRSQVQPQERVQTLIFGVYLIHYGHLNLLELFLAFKMT